MEMPQFCEHFSCACMKGGGNWFTNKGLSCSKYSFFQDNHYVPVLLHNRHIDIRPNHVCISKSRVTLTCVDEYGKSFFVDLLHMCTVLCTLL